MVLKLLFMYRYSFTVSVEDETGLDVFVVYDEVMQAITSTKSKNTIRVPQFMFYYSYLWSCFNFVGKYINCR
jgi:hypothetical protein